METVNATLSLNHRGWAVISVGSPYEAFGPFLSGIGSPFRLRALRAAIAAFRAKSDEVAVYEHDYHELWLDPEQQTARAFIDHPDREIAFEMPLDEFLPLAERWLAFAEHHPIVIPPRPRAGEHPHYPKHSE